MILACDVWGTKTNLALLEPGAGRLRTRRLETYQSQAHASLDEIVAAFVGADAPRLGAAAFGIAGPVRDGRAEATNLPWTVDGDRLARALGLDHVTLVNDVEALAWSMQRLSDSDCVPLQAGSPERGNMAIIAAGTGLGLSALLRHGAELRALASEGGHADFAPGNDAETELLRFLRHQFDHVSVERVVSGPGLVAVYEFVRSQSPDEEPEWLAEALTQGSRAARIAHAAMEARSTLAESAVLLFLGAYGAEAGNWALRTMAMGGVWLGGGVAHKLLIGDEHTSSAWRVRARDAFLTRFRAKGRMSPLLESIPVTLITTDLAPLYGAAHLALADLSLATVEHSPNTREDN